MANRPSAIFACVIIRHEQVCICCVLDDLDPNQAQRTERSIVHFCHVFGGDMHVLVLYNTRESTNCVILSTMEREPVIYSLFYHPLSIIRCSIPRWWSCPRVGGLFVSTIPLFSCISSSLLGFKPCAASSSLVGATCIFPRISSQQTFSMHF